MSLLLSSYGSGVYAQSTVDLELDDPSDVELLNEEFPDEQGISTKSNQEIDDLDALNDDFGSLDFKLPEDDSLVKKVEEVDRLKKKAKSKEKAIIFDVGQEEKNLLEVAKTMQGRIPDTEWNEIAGKSTVGTYEIKDGDYLWKISKNIFGSGFYYSKIWALNPFITNPHEVEPGMVLTFSTGSEKSIPGLKVAANKNRFKVVKESDEFDKWGDEAKPAWIAEREKLKNDGVYLQYSTGETLKDLDNVGEQALIEEYEVYEPPRLDFDITVPSDEFDSAGFDKNSKIDLNYKEGFHLNTFISTNVVQDFGKIDAAISEKSMYSKGDTMFVRFDSNIDIIQGDKFSVYTADGEIKNSYSDRKGYKYTIVGSFETVQKHNGLWECKITESSSVISRDDRVTVYTPKIERITKSYSNRIIESVVIGNYFKGRELSSFGDVVYLDRGRADGVEVGNIFEIYGFKDRATDRKITQNPTYKNGELTVISVTDNFATAVVTNSRRDFSRGDIAITKTKEAAAKAMKLRNALSSSDVSRMSDKALDELDVELNLDDLNDDLLSKADKIQFNEDELNELERQEREKSILTENEKDLKSLERLESELETAEKQLNESRLDEDKWLENQSLDKIEKTLGVDQQESLDEIEENFGKRYLDEDLNDKENPYGLTEFDIEEIDELLNLDKNQAKNEK